MPNFIFNEILKVMKSKKETHDNKILFLGVTFKENCNDFRNSKTIDLYKLFKRKNNKIDVYDPVVNADSLYNLHKIKILKKFKKEYYDLIIVSVPHKKIKKLSIKFLRSLEKKIIL